MSKLDDIIDDCLDMTSYEFDTQTYQDEIKHHDKTKQQIKDLILELIGSNETLVNPGAINTLSEIYGYQKTEARNAYRNKLRRKVEEL